MKKRFEYDKKRIGSRLRYFRKKRNLTAEDVRKILQLGSVQAIYKWENGVTIPAVDNFLALMELYDITTFEMLTKNSISLDIDSIFFIECFKSKKTFCVYSMI